MRYANKKVRLQVVCACITAALSLGACNQPKDQQNAAVDQTSGANTDEDGFIEIFDGKTLNNWDGDTAYWRVSDGNLVGQITPEKPLKTNSFIVWRGGSPRDFELKMDFKITETGNSGIQYRSEAVPDIANALRGYQADIDGRNNYTGQNYEERGRTTLAYRGERVIVNSQPNPGEEGSLRAHVKNNAWTMREVTGSLGSADSLRSLIRPNDWNTAHIVANGNRLQHYVNGVLMSDVTDNDEVNRKPGGLLGMQVHVGPPMKVEFRNIRIKEL